VLLRGTRQEPVISAAGAAGEGDEGPGGAGRDQGEDDAAVQREHESKRRYCRLGEPAPGTWS
jgi:hypothetical protein